MILNETNIDIAESNGNLDMYYVENRFNATKEEVRHALKYCDI